MLGLVPSLHSHSKVSLGMANPAFRRHHTTRLLGKEHLNRARAIFH